MIENTKDIFTRRRNGETIPSCDPQAACKMDDSSFAKVLLNEMNNAVIISPARLDISQNNLSYSFRKWVYSSLKIIQFDEKNEKQNIYVSDPDRLNTVSLGKRNFTAKRYVGTHVGDRGISRVLEGLQYDLTRGSRGFRQIGAGSYRYLSNVRKRKAKSDKDLGNVCRWGCLSVAS